MLIFADSDGNIERIYPISEEANGLCAMGGSFTDKDYLGYQTLVNFLNAANGEGFAKIVATHNGHYNEYSVCVVPEGTGRDFLKRFISLENAIALNYHPALTKAEMITFIKSDLDREEYMKNPSNDILISIFCKQMGLDKNDIIAAGNGVTTDNSSKTR